MLVHSVKICIDQRCKVSTGSKGKHLEKVNWPYIINQMEWLIVCQCAKCVFDNLQYISEILKYIPVCLKCHTWTFELKYICNEGGSDG